MSTQPLPEPEPGSDPIPMLRAWTLAVRPRTLGASLIPVAVGCAVAGLQGPLRPGIALACAATALLLQVAANLINDAVDFLRGIDTESRQGPLRVTQAGWLPASHVLRAAGGALGLAVLGGSTLVWHGGVPILALGVAAVVAAAAYSWGPFPLASHALGEAAAFLFFGVLAVTGTAYLQSGHFSLFALLASLPVAALVANLMGVNNLRDIESDAAAGKRTLAVRLGADATRAGYLGLLGLAYATPVALWAVRPESPGVFLTWASLPLALRLARSLGRAPGPGVQRGAFFEAALSGTARLHGVYGVLLCLGLLW